ncbi:type II toxin-antitoxin system RelE family toxin [Romboutsia sp.]|uniref:type II toxin-antitoxin system RelE family toxin n=1 Tax=Romboutsia sp. TaxID=1965302 RepID=UPI0039C9A072
MGYKVFVSRTFQKIYSELPRNIRDRIKEHLQELENDLVTSRSRCDIKMLRDTDPKKYRLRVGEYRIIYAIEDRQVKILDCIKREIGYGHL